MLAIVQALLASVARTSPSVAFPQFGAPYWGIPQDLYTWTSGGMWNHRLAYGDAHSVQGSVDRAMMSGIDRMDTYFKTWPRLSRQEESICSIVCSFRGTSWSPRKTR